MDEKLVYEEETFAIRGAIFEVYKTLGDGYLEEVYQNAMEEELKLRGIPFAAKKELHIMYKGRDCGLYMPDLICFDRHGNARNTIPHAPPLHDSQIPNAADLKFSPLPMSDQIVAIPVRRRKLLKSVAFLEGRIYGLNMRSFSFHNPFRAGRRPLLLLPW